MTQLFGENVIKKQHFAPLGKDWRPFFEFRTLLRVATTSPRTAALIYSSYLGSSFENVQRESEFPTPYEFVEYLLDEIPLMGDVKNVNRHFAAQYTQYYFHTQFS